MENQSETDGKISAAALVVNETVPSVSCDDMENTIDENTVSTMSSEIASNCRKSHGESTVAENHLIDIGFMFDKELSKVFRKFEFGVGRVSVDAYFIDDEPGACQSGHYVWPAALALAEYIASSWEHFEPQSVLEIGAGCGLTGLTAAMLGPSTTVVLTDHDPGILSLLEENVKLQRPPIEERCFVEDLVWGIQGESKILQLKEILGSPAGAELLLGSDVVYSPEIVDALFWSVNAILSHAGVFILACSFSLGEEVEQRISRCAQQYGLSWRHVRCELGSSGVRIREFRRLQSNALASAV